MILPTRGHARPAERQQNAGGMLAEGCLAAWPAVHSIARGRKALGRSWAGGGDWSWLVVGEGDQHRLLLWPQVVARDHGRNTTKRKLGVCCPYTS